MARKKPTPTAAPDSASSETAGASAIPKGAQVLAFNPRGMPRIDPMELLLGGQSAPSVPIPPRVARVIERKARSMADEAYKLCLEHLSRRVAYRAEFGQPRAVDEDTACEVVEEGDLGDALAHAYFTRLRRLRGYVEGAVDSGRRLLDEVDEAIAREGLSSPAR